MIPRPPIRQLPSPLPRGSCLGRRTFISLRSRKSPSGRAVEQLNINRLSRQSDVYQRNRRVFLVSGAVAGVVSFLYTAWKLKQALVQKPTKLDSGLPSTDPLAGSDVADRNVVVYDDESREIVPTGNSTVAAFPRTIELPSYTHGLAPPNAMSDLVNTAQPVSTATAGRDGATTPPTEYTLVGLGLRTVSFLGIQVYVVGYYVATSDIAALQSALVKKVNPILATMLVPGERDQLRAALLDPAEGEETWRELLERGIPSRSAFRVVPVRDTDFHHLRDGFVRAIQARSPPAGTATEGLGEAVGEFRALFNRGSVPKRKELLLIRDGQGRLSIVYGDGRTGGRQLLGTVDDERISRALWLNYLAGKKVASEPARKSIVEGIMEFVERPVGTAAAQVL